MEERSTVRHLWDKLRVCASRDKFFDEFRGTGIDSIAQRGECEIPVWYVDIEDVGLVENIVRNIAAVLWFLVLVLFGLLFLLSRIAE